MANNIDIPNDWEVKKLGEVVNINNSSLKENTDPNYAFTYIDLSSVNQGKIDIPIEQIYFKEAPSRARRLIEINNIIISTVRPNLQGFAYIDFTCKDYIVSTGFAVLSYKCNINMKFLYNMFYSNILMKQINAIITGSNYPAISSADIKNFIIPVPPLAEQEKIAEILSLWDKAIEQTKELIAYKEKQKKGLMQNLLTGKKRLHGFNDDWETITLGEVCEYQNGDSNEENIINNGNYLLITLNSIDINGRLKKEHKRINQGKPILYKNDIVMILSDIAHGFLLGLSAVIDENNKYILNQRVGLLRPKKQINSLFLSYLINLNQLYFKKHGQGSSQLNLSKGDIINFQLYIPLNIEEQNFIVKTISKADEEIELLKKQLDLYMEQKKGLMQNLLTGKVRVTV